MAPRTWSRLVDTPKLINTPKKSLQAPRRVKHCRPTEAFDANDGARTPKHQNKAPEHMSQLLSHAALPKKSTPPQLSPRKTLRCIFLALVDPTSTVYTAYREQHPPPRVPCLRVTSWKPRLRCRVVFAHTARRSQAPQHRQVRKAPATTKNHADNTNYAPKRHENVGEPGGGTVHGL